MKNKHEQIEEAMKTKEQMPNSAIDLWRLMGGQSHRVREEGKPPPDAMLAVLGDRVTYTFIMEDEVASIHFDRMRGEIFFKGHNIRHLTLSDRQREALLKMKEVLSGDEKAKVLFSDYSATLDRCLTDNK